MNVRILGVLNDAFAIFVPFGNDKNDDATFDRGRIVDLLDDARVDEGGSIVGGDAAGLDAGTSRTFAVVTECSFVHVGVFEVAVRFDEECTSWLIRRCIRLAGKLVNHEVDVDGLIHALDVGGKGNNVAVFEEALFLFGVSG